MAAVGAIGASIPGASSASALKLQPVRRALLVFASLAALAGASAVGFTVWSAATLPRIDRTGPIVRIANCEQPRDKNAQSVCPRLYCEKALGDAGIVQKDARVQETARIGYEGDRRVLIGGTIRTGDSVEPAQHFQCWMLGDIVEKIEAVDPREWAQKRRNGEWQI